MKLLDTNVVVYAQGGLGPYKEPCLAVMAEARDRPGEYAVDVEALQELLEVYGRRGQRVLAVATVQDVLAAFPDPLPVTRREVEQATSIFKGHRKLSPRDAVHAAVVFTYGLEGIVSADKGFDRVAGLTRFDPLDLAGA